MSCSGFTRPIKIGMKYFRWLHFMVTWKVTIYMLYSGYMTWIVPATKRGYVVHDFIKRDSPGNKIKRIGK